MLEYPVWIASQNSPFNLLTWNCSKCEKVPFLGFSMMWHGIPGLLYLGLTPISTTPCRQIGSVYCYLSWWAQLNYVNKYTINTVLRTPYIYCVLSNLASTEVTSLGNDRNPIEKFQSQPFLKNCQNGTFTPLHEIWIFLWPNAFIWSAMKLPSINFIQNMSQVPSA